MFYHVFQCLSIVIEQKGMNPVLPREILTPQIYKKKTNTVVFFQKKINIYSYSTSYGEKRVKARQKKPAILYGWNEIVWNVKCEFCCLFFRSLDMTSLCNIGITVYKTKT